MTIINKFTVFILLDFTRKNKDKYDKSNQNSKKIKFYLYIY